jgi:hypothetical protein
LSGYIWDGQYDGEEHEENVAQQVAGKPVLNPSSTPSICYFSNEYLHILRIFYAFFRLINKELFCTRK